MKRRLNSHVNDSNFSVVFDSRVKDGAQCCMFLQLWNQVYSWSLLAALMMLDAQRQLHELKTLYYKTNIYLLKTSHSTSAFYLVQFKLHCWNNLWNQKAFYFKIHLGYSLNFIHFENTFFKIFKFIRKNRDCI